MNTFFEKALPDIIKLTNDHRTIKQLTETFAGYQKHYYEQNKKSWASTWDIYYQSDVLPSLKTLADSKSECNNKRSDQEERASKLNGNDYGYGNGNGNGYGYGYGNNDDLSADLPPLDGKSDKTKASRLLGLSTIPLTRTSRRQPSVMMSQKPSGIQRQSAVTIDTDATFDLARQSARARSHYFKDT